MTRIHHLFHRTAREHPGWRVGPRFPRIHKGLQYTVLPAWLRPVSTEVYREHLEEERLGIAISMGGADAPNVTLSLLRQFGQTRLKLVIWVALGDAYTHSYGELLACAAHNRQEIILLKSNDSMWRVVKNASLVLCAGGLTTYEAAFVGLPTINLIRNDNWGYLFEELVARGACYVIPSVPERADHAVAMVAELDANRQRLLRCHLATRGVIPEGGAERIAETLSQLYAEVRS
jgi:spore coat polysaccharide biosynthesis predicted glycosyltransferase SpsG